MERLKNMELKKTFLVLSASCVLVALLMLGLVFMICNSISSNFPSGGIEILADGSIVKMETPTETQQNILSMLGIIQIVSCIVLPMGGLALSGILYYHIKLKQPISTLRNGISRIRNHDLDFSMPVHSDDELGQLCTAFDTMREELLKSNQELWRQAEERKRLNAAFSHDLRNPITVLKGTIKLLRQGTADEQAIDRLESYTLRIEQYAEAMSSIQRLEQMPVRMPLLLDKKQPDEVYLNQLTDLLGIRERLTHLPHELSGGQQQRVAIARALIAKPDIIFADEPTGNLDSKSGGEVMEMLQSIWKKMGKTLVIITHDSRIARMADRQFVIVDGVLSEVTAR